ncbi:GerAB/ArcD/ProY family transporter [Hazenella coriacea]|uniref:Spore germination protein (Amino acid permease) n=1 Tax=Hazenella coriacea TaxID=1179467 RepID=A0A4R3LA91_9BACL|nr:endospore germination permease [Hazenella coriacea]TCS96649.1 spore germination protein (amino acid permease) [Hazenella coriacea]
MNHSSDKISSIQAIFILVTAVGVLDHVIIMPTLLESSGRDAWITVLFSAILFLLWLPIIYVIMKRTHQEHLYQWLKNRWGKVIATIIISFIVLELFLMISMTLRDVTYWANISYLPETPNFVLVITLITVCFYAAYSGIRVIAIVNGILLPVVILLGLFVAIANFQHKDYSLLFPVFEQGLQRPLSGMLYAGSGFVGITLLVIMQHQLKSKIRLLPLYLTGLTLIILMLGPLIGAIIEFGPYEASRLRFPAFEEWRLVTFGRYLENVDFLSIYQWLVGSFVRISIALFLLPDLLLIQTKKKRFYLLLFISGTIIIISQIPISDLQFITYLAKFYLPYTFITSVTISFLFFFATFGKSERMKSQ